MQQRRFAPCFTTTQNTTPAALHRTTEHPHAKRLLSAAPARIAMRKEGYSRAEALIWPTEDGCRREG